jgi:hypothetical protein
MAWEANADGDPGVEGRFFPGAVSRRLEEGAVGFERR